MKRLFCFALCLLLVGCSFQRAPLKMHYLQDDNHVSYEFEVEDLDHIDIYINVYKDKEKIDSYLFETLQYDEPVKEKATLEFFLEDHAPKPLLAVKSVSERGKLIKKNTEKKVPIEEDYSVEYLAHDFQFNKKHPAIEILKYQNLRSDISYHVEIRI